MVPARGEMHVMPSEKKLMTSQGSAEHVDAVIVGAGFAGLYMLHRLRDKLGLKAEVIEAATGVGGTWFWNRYPGARCDIQSVHYSYAFSEELQQEWTWSEKYAAQPEILSYLNFVADRFDLRRSISLGTRVIAATFDEASNTWDVETDTGRRLRARYLISAVGCLSAGHVPSFSGVEAFAGKTYHTGRWPVEGVDFTGQRVGIIGTGSTAIQTIPFIAQQASHLTVFQRSATYATPLGNTPSDLAEGGDGPGEAATRLAMEWESWAGVPFPKIRPSGKGVSAEERSAWFEECWAQGGFALWGGSYADLLFDPELNEAAAEFIRAKIRLKVRDPAVAELLTPRGIPYGTKRPVCETGFYETFNRDNVTLVDIKAAPIVEITATGLRTAAATHELDALIFATGFDAFTGALFAMNIRGCGGKRLQDHWGEGPRNYLGLSIHGFPNLFTITGPFSPSVLFNMPRGIEQHCDWIAESIAQMERQNLVRMEATAEAEAAWMTEVKAIADMTLFPTTDSWYLGANIPGKPRVFMVFLAGGKRYKEICDEVVADNYRGFALSPA